MKIDKVLSFAFFKGAEQFPSRPSLALPGTPPPAYSPERTRSHSRNSLTEGCRPDGSAWCTSLWWIVTLLKPLRDETVSLGTFKLLDHDLILKVLAANCLTQSTNALNFLLLFRRLWWSRRRHRGGAGDASPQPDLKRCWHDTWFHWKSSPKICLYSALLKSLKINLR